MYKIKPIVCMMPFLKAGAVYVGYRLHKTVDAAVDVGRWTSIALDAKRSNQKFVYIPKSEQKVKFGYGRFILDLSQ